MLCYCGHDCSRCLTYLATKNDDERLKAQARKFYLEEFGLDIPPEKFICDGGRSERVFELCKQCPFVICCHQHHVERCADCPEYPCNLISAYEAKYVNRCNQIE